MSDANPGGWPDPSPEMLNGDPLFDAIWQTIKRWDVNVPGVYLGYMGATGNHVRAIYDAVSPAVAAQVEAARREERDGLQAALDTIAAQRDAALKDGFLAGFRARGAQ